MGGEKERLERDSGFREVGRLHRGNMGIWGAMLQSHVQWPAVLW